MFTRYKGIEIPQNYSGNRFKSEAPITETKMHKPSMSYGTKTSISPTFESALRQDTSNELEAELENEFVDPVSNFSQNEIDYDENFSSPIEAPFVEEKVVKSSVLDDFKPLISNIIKNVNSEDLLLLSLVILLMSDGNEDSSEIIIPLLLLFLYH